MSSEPLDIKVIYSASGRPARAVKPAKTAKPARPKEAAVAPTASAALRAPALRRSNSRRAILALGALNFLMGMTLLIITWWPVDSYIYQKFVYKMPVDLVQLGPLFGMTPQQIAESTAATPEPALPPPTLTGTTAQTVIAASGYGWLTLSTLACYTLALASGMAFGQLFQPAWRRYAGIFFLGAMMGLIIGAYFTWKEHGARYPMEYLRTGMVMIGLTIALLGMSIGRGTFGWSRAAGGQLILAALASAVGLFLGQLAGAVSPEHAAPLFLLLVFVAHSLYGWLLWFGAPRWAMR